MKIIDFQTKQKQKKKHEDRVYHLDPELKGPFFFCSFMYQKYCNEFLQDHFPIFPHSVEFNQVVLVPLRIIYVNELCCNWWPWYIKDTHSFWPQITWAHQHGCRLNWWIYLNEFVTSQTLNSKWAVSATVVCNWWIMEWGVHFENISVYTLHQTSEWRKMTCFFMLRPFKRVEYCMWWWTLGSVDILSLESQTEVTWTINPPQPWSLRAWRTFM